MTRHGLWGRGTYFADFKAIETVLSAGGGTGAGAMEMLAVQLKSSGAYLARSRRLALAATRVAREAKRAGAAADDDDAAAASAQRPSAQGGVRCC